MDLFQELNNLMVKYSFTPSKKMAQFFIIDDAVIQKLIDEAELKEKDVVLEIGAGTGFLTRELQKRCKTIAYELDDRLFELLEAELPPENIELIHGDFLYAELPEFSKVVSLPPYNNASEIVFKLLEKKFDKAVLVFQREFCEKIIAQPGYAEYGALSVVAQHFYDIEIISNVSSNAFFPSPKAFSSVMKFSARGSKAVRLSDEEFFPVFVKTLFRFQNKNLGNALQTSWHFIKGDLKISDKDYEKRTSALKLKNEKVNLLEVEEFAEIFNKILG